MHLAVTTLGCPSWPVARVFDEAARLGFEGVELRCLRGGLIGPELPAEDRAEIRRCSRDAGLPVVALGASSAFSDPDPAVRAAQEADLRGMLELAHDLEAPLVRAYGGGLPGPVRQDRDRSYGGELPADRRAEAIRYIAASFDRVAPRAEELGITIVVETHDGLSSAHVAAEVLRLVRSPRVQALWDVLHPTRMGESPAEVWATLGPWVRHVHFKDARRGPDGRWRAALLGEGEVPLQECLRVLRAAGYRGWLTLEWEKYWEPDIPEPEVAFPHMIAVARAWLEAL